MEFETVFVCLPRTVCGTGSCIPELPDRINVLKYVGYFFLEALQRRLGNQSINQNSYMHIAPCVASESEARDGID